MEMNERNHISHDDGERSTQYSNGDFSHDTLGAKHVAATGQESRKRDILASIRDGWFWEITSIIFSAACIVAMIIFLRVLDGKEIPSWNDSVSPNTITAVASTAAKAAMILVIAEAIGQLKWLHLRHGKHSLYDIQVYDEATRGPLGAFHFLQHFLRKSPAVTYIAMLGGIVTILAIATDPFTQQILRYVTRPTPAHDSIASLKHAEAYDFGGTGVGGASNVLTGVRDSGVTAAIMSGLFNTELPIQYSCPSSNCTWPAFTTLGVTSDCSDVTSDTTHSCTTNNETGWQNCVFTLPHDVKLEATTTNDAHSGFTHTLANATTIGSFFSTVSPADAEALGVTSASMIIFPDGTPSSETNQTAWRDTLKAWQCSLSVVAYAYSNISVHSGQIQTPDVRTSPLNVTFGSVISNMSATAPDWPYEGNYTINILDTQNLGSIFIFLLDYSEYPYGTLNPNIANALTSSANNISGVFDTISSSITHHMMSSSPNGTTLDGKVLYPITYIEVRWAWLTLQAALLVLAFIFLVTAIVLTQAEHAPVWKSSVYPLIALNLRGDHVERDLAETDWKLSQMEHELRKTKTGLFSGREKGSGMGVGVSYERL